jgi:phage-related minor tail protein
MGDTVETWTYQIDADTEPLQRQLAIAAGAGRQFGRQLTSAFEGVALQGRGLNDVLKSLALGFSRMTLQAAFKPLEQGLGSLFSGLLTSPIVTSAKGNVFAGGMPVPFASGGVISSPVAFPLRGGQVGIAGERGAEAIMPLARGADGRLGVRSMSAGSGITVTFNVTTPDAESFRRSQTQLAAMLARTVSQGQRNL